MKTKLALIIAMLLFATLQFSKAEQFTDEKHNGTAQKSLSVHGRLRVYNGTPSCRIWIVGTKRILGIHETDEECPIPTRLHQVLQENINDRVIYADFTVLPLTEHRKGIMQIVRFQSARNVVVTSMDGRVLKQIEGSIGEKDTEPGSTPDRQEKAPASR